MNPVPTSPFADDLATVPSEPVDENDIHYLVSSLGVYNRKEVFYLITLSTHFIYG